MKDRPTRFFVSNCDILVDVNYISALEFHERGRVRVYMVGALEVNVLWCDSSAERGVRPYRGETGCAVDRQYGRVSSGAVMY